ncbi:hypothetical protein [Endozoicomonas sp.]|uniref:hypothetical protein n=1 Tax=Endozoicomonas sp. TaxID=1892382 RepID=UPI003AF95FF5
MEGDPSNTEALEHKPLFSWQITANELSEEAESLQECYINEMYGDCNVDEYEEARRGLNAISAATYQDIMSVKGVADNNADYYQQLRAGNLPSDYTYQLSEDKWQRIKALNVGNIYIFGLLRYLEGENSKLEDDFGLYFVPSKAWMGIAVDKLRAKFSREFSGEGLEIMAGQGALSHFLNENYELKVKATDIFKTHQHIVSEATHCIGVDVLEMDAVSAIRKNRQAEFLVISWPPGDREIQGGVISNPNDVEILDAWACRGPILFIGLRRSFAGVWLTGSEAFHKKLLKQYGSEVIEAYRSKSFAIRYEAVLFTPKNERWVKSTVKNTALAQGTELF